MRFTAGRSRHDRRLDGYRPEHSAPAPAPGPDSCPKASLAAGSAAASPARPAAAHSVPQPVAGAAGPQSAEHLSHQFDELLAALA